MVDHLDRIKNEIYQELAALFANIAVCNLAYDIEGLKAEYKKLATVADTLGVKTEIRDVTIQLKE